MDIIHETFRIRYSAVFDCEPERDPDGEYTYPATTHTYSWFEAGWEAHAALDNEELERWKARATAAENGHPQFKEMQDELERLRANQPAVRVRRIRKRVG